MAHHEAQSLVDIARNYYLSGFGRGPEFYEMPGSIVASVDGHYGIDVFGNRFLDTEMTASASYLGFGRREVIDALVAEMGRVPSTTPLFVPTPPVLRLAEKLASLTPGNLKYSLFGVTGSDAIEGGIKAARQYWKLLGKGGKFKTLHRVPGDFHGSSLAMCSASGLKYRRAQYEPLMGGFVAFNSPYCYRCPYEASLPRCRLLCARELERVIQFEDPQTVACVITENTNTGLGVVTPPPGYMQMIRDICTRYEVLLIVDEVLTGVAKTGAWFESEKHGFVPDIMSVGKSITAGCGGLSITHVTEPIGEVLLESRNLHHPITFAGLGYLAAAGLAGIAYVEQHDLLARARHVEKFMMSRFSTLATQSQVIGDVRATGVLQGIEFVMDKESKRPFPDPKAVSSFVSAVGHEHGVLLNCLYSYYTNIIHLYLPLTITDAELALVYDTVEDVAERIEKRFL